MNDPYPEPAYPTRRSPFPTLALVLVAFLAGVLLDRYGLLPGGSGEPASVRRTFAPFWEAWRDVHEYYVDRKAVNDQHMTEGAIVGMLASLGDIGHTTYLTREESQALQNQLKGQFQGIGARLTVQNGQPTILQVMPDSPALKAGLRDGDVIVAVDGKDVASLSLQQLVDRVRGPAGTEVRLSVRRQGEARPINITVTRAKIHVPDVAWHLLPGTPVAHLALREFGKNADDQLARALDEARKRGARALIVDVRGNPGGLKDQAVAVTSEFLQPGETVFIQQNARGQRTEVKVLPNHSRAAGIPVCVLIDGGTASSAEIFAGALQDYGRARLVGTRTFGTGTVLRPFPLSDGSAILLAVDEWLTPKGRQIWHKGISPDEGLEVKLPRGARILLPEMEDGLTAEKLAKSEDKQLLEALEVLKKQLGENGH